MYKVCKKKLETLHFYQDQWSLLLDLLRVTGIAESLFEFHKLSNKLEEIWGIERGH
jgi:hypothetical protein